MWVKKEVSDFGLMCARVARYYGWLPHEIESLDVNTFMEYHEAMGMLQSQEYLMDLKISTAPKYKKEDYDKFYSSIERQAFPLKRKKVSSEDEINRFLGKL